MAASKIPAWLKFLITEYPDDAKRRGVENFNYMAYHFEKKLGVSPERMMRVAQAYVTDQTRFPHIGQLMPYLEADMYTPKVVHTDDELLAIEQAQGTMRPDVAEAEQREMAEARETLSRIDLDRVIKR